MLTGVLIGALLWRCAVLPIDLALSAHSCAQKLPRPTRPLAVCTMVRNSCSQLYNWVEYHRFVGVTKFTFYLVDEQDCSRDVLQELVDQGVVELFRWPADGFTSLALKNYSTVQPTVEGFTNRDLRFHAHLKMLHPSRSGETLPSHLEMLSLCAGQVQLTDSNEFDLKGTPFNWEFCQVTALADCMSGHSDFPGWLGLFDVDEFMLPAPPHRTLQQAFREAAPLGSMVDQVAVSGMIFGSSHVYPPLLPTDVVPLAYHSHATNDWDATELEYRTVGSSQVRAYAIKSFYHMPRALRSWGHKGIPIAIHSARPLRNSSQMRVIPRDGGSIRYNHYMYRSTEELALAGMLISNKEKRPSADLMDAFNAVKHDTRMDHMLPRFLPYWSECSIPALQARLLVHARQRLKSSTDPDRHALNASEREALRLYNTSLLTVATASREPGEVGPRVSLGPKLVG